MAHSSEEQRKALQIACDNRDINALQRLSIREGGFLEDALRSRAWPILLGYEAGDGATLDENEEVKLWAQFEKHRDEDQVELDVNRSFVHYPASISESDLSYKRTELSNLIRGTLRQHPYLCYFQGYHDICQVFLLALPHHLRGEAVARLSALRIRDFMLPSLEPALAQLKLIPEVLRLADPKLHAHLAHTRPWYALSGALTMYAHNIENYADIVRLFDAILSHEQVFCIYLFARIVLDRREELYEIPSQEEDMLHSVLSKLPRPLDVDLLVSHTADLCKAIPPQSLEAWRDISRASVLKTAYDAHIVADQSMEDGHRFFEEQRKGLIWDERRQKMFHMMQKYQKPARGVVLAFLVGAAAIYLRSNPGPWKFITSLWSKL